MNAAKISVSQLTLYNPARLKDAEIVAAFVARKAVFERMLADIATEKPRSRAQHHLIVGQRGMGKSTMLARLAAELRTNAELSKRFVPLVFAEEQYAVDRLSKFWLNCLDSLADAAERAGDTAASDRIDAIVRTLKPQPGGTAEKDEAPARAALDAFLKAAESSGKRPVFLVDNLQLVFERISGNEQHALRELLMRTGSPILIGASPSPPPESQDYGAAFYDHFKIHYLRPLSADEMRDLMLKLAETTERADVRDKVLAHPERLKTLRDLTGGNPRTVVTLFFLYAEDFSPSVFADLENLLDRVTPLYKARIEELAEQQQVVVSAVADHWSPITARDLSEATGLPMASISAQLDRLEKTGFVEKVEIFDQSSAGYQIAERFFNVWFLMRSASRRQRREVEFLVRFIESFYEAKDRPRLAHHLMNERDFSPDRHLFVQALGCTLDSNNKEELTRHAELDALRQKAADARRKLEEVIDFSKLPPATLAFDELREKLMALVPADTGVVPEKFAEAVLSDRQMFIRGEREKLAATREKLNKDKINAILGSISFARVWDFSTYGKSSVDWFNHWLSSGQLRSLENSEDWNRSFLKADETSTVQMMVDSIPLRIGTELEDDVRLRLRNSLTPKSNTNAWMWIKWGHDLHEKLGWYSEAEAAYRKAIELDPRLAIAWSNLGNLLHVNLDRFEEAEAAYRKAIELDPKSIHPLNNLGNLFANYLRRFEEAEAAYIKTLELDPRFAPAWNNLGNLFHVHLRRFEDAEVAYRKAIELNPRSTFTLNNLGNLLQDHLGRFAEAEVAYLKAIELDQHYAHPWNGFGNLLQAHFGLFKASDTTNHKAIEPDSRLAYPWIGLGNLLQDHLGRFTEAEAAYRKAIEIDPRLAYPWNNLGNLLMNHLSRFTEAEAAYRKAIELDPRFTYVWFNLGNLLMNHLGRFAEAEAAYRKAIELDPRFAYPWNSLGNLYCDHCRRYSDAALAFAKAIEFEEISEMACDNLVFLHRDFRGDKQTAKNAFDPLRSKPQHKYEDSFHLHEALFAAYDANWGLCCEALVKAIKVIGQQFPASTADDWFRASAVLLHLNFGEELLAFLHDRGDDAKLRPWYEALSALHRVDRRYLQNIPVEVRTTAEYYFDQIEKRLNALPEKTRRRPVPKPAKKRRKT